MILLKSIINFLLILVGVTGIIIVGQPGFHWYTIVGLVLSMIVTVPAINYYRQMWNKQKEPVGSISPSIHDLKRYLYGKELIFISSIKRDGSGTNLFDYHSNDMSHLDNTKFSITRLSISEDTYIACEFNSFIVKLKKT